MHCFGNTERVKIIICGTSYRSRPFYFETTKWFTRESLRLVSVLIDDFQQNERHLLILELFKTSSFSRKKKNVIKSRALETLICNLRDSIYIQTTAAVVYFHTNHHHPVSQLLKSTIWNDAERTLRSEDFYFTVIIPLNKNYEKIKICMQSKGLRFSRRVLSQNAKSWRR